MIEINFDELFTPKKEYIKTSIFRLFRRKFSNKFILLITSKFN